MEKRYEKDQGECDDTLVGNQAGLQDQSEGVFLLADFQRDTCGAPFHCADL